MFFAQSISLSLSLVAAFTISDAIFSTCLLHSIYPSPPNPSANPSPYSSTQDEEKRREEIPLSCGNAIPSVKIASSDMKRNQSSKERTFCPGGKKEEMQSATGRPHIDGGMRKGEER
jgi:hypothetical protein